MSFLTVLFGLVFELTLSPAIFSLVVPALEGLCWEIEAVLKLERDGELVTGSFDGPGALLQRLQQVVPEERQFDDRSIEPVVGYLFEHLLCGPPRRN